MINYYSMTLVYINNRFVGIYPFDAVPARFANNPGYTKQNLRIYHNDQNNSMATHPYDLGVDRQEIPDEILREHALAKLDQIDRHVLGLN